MVGEVMLRVLAERNFPITELLPVASARSVGKSVSFSNKLYTVIGLEEAVAAVQAVDRLDRAFIETFDESMAHIHYDSLTIREVEFEPF